MLQSLLGLPSGVANAATSPPVLAPAAPEPKGVFGVKGGLRDILGILGDSLSVGAGGTAKFTAGNQQRKAQAAMRDFATNPLGAIRAMADVDPEMARKLYDDYQKQTIATGKDARDAAKDTIELSDKTLSLEDKVRANVAAMLRSSGNPDTYPALRKQAEAYGKKYNVPIDNLPETFDKDAIDSWAMNTVPVKDQLANEDRMADNARDAAYKKADIAIKGGRLVANTNLAAGRLTAGTTIQGGRLTKPTGKGSKTTGSKPTGKIRINKTNNTVEYQQPDGTWKSNSK